MGDFVIELAVHLRVGRMHAVGPDVGTPAVFVLAGRNDPIVLSPNGQLLADLLPRCRQTLLDGGHLIREDAADAYSAQLAQWVHGGYRSVPLRRSG